MTTEAEELQHIGDSHHVEMPNPTPDMLASPLFEAIWQAIKSWDVNVPESYAGYCGANGSHVAIIVNAISALAAAQVRQDGWRVKPLEWRDKRAAQMAFGIYQITQYGRPWAVYLNNNLIAEPDTEELAKAAAQSDYERRIRSAIEPAEGAAVMAMPDIARCSPPNILALLDELSRLRSRIKELEGGKP